MSELLDDAVRELSRLPGIGRRTALRLTLHMLRMDEEEVRRMTAAIDRFRSDIKYCARCNNLSDSDVCTICSDPSRDRSVVCVVEQVGDVLSIENTRQYQRAVSCARRRHIAHAGNRSVRPKDRPAVGEYREGGG